MSSVSPKSPVLERHNAWSRLDTPTQPEARSFYGNPEILRGWTKVDPLPDQSAVVAKVAESVLATGQNLVDSGFDVIPKEEPNQGSSS